MKKLHLLTAAIFCVLAVNARAVLITNFGTPGFVDNGGGTYSVTQNSTAIILVGVEGNDMYGDLAAPVDISSQLNFLSITGTYTGAYNGQFNVELFDADGDSRLYTGSFTSFTPSVSTPVTIAFASETGTFNGFVTLIGFSASGLGTDSTNITLTNLSTAVPEPTTWALLAGGLTTVLVMRRRRK